MRPPQRPRDSAACTQHGATGRWGTLRLVLALFVTAGLGLAMTSPRASALLLPQAKEGPREESVKPAVIVFHANPSRILDSNLMKTIGLYDQLDDLQQRLWQAQRVRGAFALPDELEILIQNEAQTPPFDFYIEYQMKNEKQIDGIRDLFAAMQFEIRDENDDQVTVYASKNSPGFYMALTKSRLVIIASDSMPYRAGEFPELTTPAEQIWKDTQRSSAGLAVDFLGAEKLIQAGVEFGKENFPPPFATQIEPLTKLTQGRAELQLVPKSGLQAVLDCVDNQAAGTVKEAIDGLVALGKVSLNAPDHEITAPDPEITLLQKFLSGIKTEAVGKQVRIKVGISPELMTRMGALEESQQNRMRMGVLTWAMSKHLDATNRLPFSTPAGQSSELSWMVRLLPYIGGAGPELYEQFDLTQGPNSPLNRNLVDSMPMAFGQGNQTRLRWVESGITKLSDITDGTQNTIAFIHGGPPVNWTENTPVTVEQAKEWFRNLGPQEFMIVGYYDGSVRVLRKTRNMTESEAMTRFEAMLTPSGGEFVPDDF